MEFDYYFIHIQGGLDCQFRGPYNTAKEQCLAAEEFRGDRNLFRDEYDGIDYFKVTKGAKFGEPEIVDFGFWENEREYQNEHLTEVLKEKGKEGCAWSISVEDFGWRNLSVKGCAILEDASDFYEKVLPDCQCTWEMYATNEGLRVKNWHHDSPMGESYYLTPIELDKYYEWKEEHA